MSWSGAITALACFIILLSPCDSIAKPPEVRGAVALIPGISSVLVPRSPDRDSPYNNRYFSTDIMNSIAERGFAVHEVEDLAATGTIEHNGEIAYRDIKNWYLSEFPNQDAPLILLGHSAGGLYGLYVLQQLDDSLPVTHLLTLATPYLGVKGANAFLGGPLSKIVNLKGLSEMTTANVQKFLSTVRISDQTAISAFAGKQKFSFILFPSLNYRSIHPYYRMALSFMDGASDGLVSVDSATPVDLRIPSIQGGSIRVQSHRDQLIPLDHSEMHVDYRTLKRMLFTRNAHKVSEIQKATYGHWVDALAP